MWWILGFLSKIWRTKAELNGIARYGDIEFVLPDDERKIHPPKNGCNPYGMQYQEPTKLMHCYV